MKYKAHGYQKKATERILQQKRVGLFLDMGLGKTVITLTAIKELIEDFAIWKVLVIAPKRVAEDTWSREHEKWDHLSGLRISKVLGTPAQRMKALKADADVYVIGRDNVKWLVELYGKTWPFDMVVIDELSSFKNPSAQRFKALRKVIPMFDQFRDRMTYQGGRMGMALKRQSDVIMDATFHRDIAFRKCYLQDKDTIFPEQTEYGYRQAKAVYTGKAEYDPSELKGFSPIDAKYLVKSYYSISGDTIDYYLQFRPNVHGTNLNIRVGAYIFIPDDLGVYNLWLIVARDDRPQFPQFYVLRCDFLAKWHISHEDAIRYEGAHVDTGTYFSWAVARIQSSYNSGVKVLRSYLVMNR